MAENDEAKHAALAYFTSVHDAVWAANEDENLWPTQLAFILYLGTMGPGATPTDISAKYGMTQAHTAKFLKALREAGFIHPVPHETDGRVKHYYITEKGAHAAIRLARRGKHTLRLDDMKWVRPTRTVVRGS